MVRRFARLRPDRAVVLVLDLQDVRVELPPLAVDDDADRLVARLHGRDGGRERGDVLRERVRGDREAPLRLVAIAQVAHPQRRRVRAVPRVGVELGQHLVPVGPERLAERGRRAKQVHHEPCVPPVIAHEAHELGGAELVGRLAAPLVLAVGGPKGGWRGVVEVHARDRLHRAPVAVAEPAAVDRLHLPRVRRAVVRDRDLAVRIERAGHARGPEQLAVEPAMRERVQVAEKLQRLPVALLRRGDELGQRLGVVGGEIGMSQRRAERTRMGPMREVAALVGAQALLLDAAQPPPHERRVAGLAEPVEARRELVARRMHSVLRAGSGHRATDLK